MRNDLSAPRLLPSRDVVLRTISGESFLLPVRGDLVKTVELFVLTEVGRFVWDLADGSRGVDEIVPEVVRAFEVDEGRARADVSAFVERLREYGLLEVAA